MKTLTNALLLWLPRILTIAFAIFVSLFALDVFDERLSFWKTILYFTMHLIPTFTIIVVLGLAWRWEWIGALAFVSLSLGYLLFAWGRFHWSAYLVISGPLLLIGLLFTVSWFYRERISAAR